MVVRKPVRREICKMMKRRMRNPHRHLKGATLLLPAAAVVILLGITSPAKGFLGVRDFPSSSRLFHQQEQLLTVTLSSTRQPVQASQIQQRHQSRQQRNLSANIRSSATPTQLAAEAADSNNYDAVCDVLVLGSGPAGRAVASLLHASSSTHPLKVILSDQNLDRAFPPNYGVWHDEWDTVVDRYATAGVALQGGHCQKAIDHMWSLTDCYFGGSFDIPVAERMRLDRPYWRVDRHALRTALTNGYSELRANHASQCLSVPNLYSPAQSLVHDDTGSTIQLRKRDGTLQTVRAKFIVDCTGHETKLVLRESRTPGTPPPGFQIAYGCLVDVTGKGVTDTHIGPYDRKAMTLFDYRTDHYDDFDPATRDKVVKDPTFMYAMPLEGNQIFFEETSLVARPAMSFQECKDRCLQRLAYHGIEVTTVHEEEFCYIPMGGALPAKDQRVLAVGGAAAMVHPSTGFHLCRCLVGASDVAAVLARALAPSTKSPANLDRTAAAAYHALWSPDNVRQRNFAVFGGDYLMQQDVVGLRGFFDGFFRLPMPLWAGFLAGWPGLPNNDKHATWWARLWYGLNFVARLPPSVALNMFGSIVSYVVFTDLALAQSVTPFLGEPDSFECKTNLDNQGDVAAKNEARRMIEESKVMEDLPVDFEEATNNKAAMPSSFDRPRSGSTSGVASPQLATEPAVSSLAASDNGYQ